VSDLVLEGLDGSNPLGFLCALGAFSVLAEFWPVRPVRISWCLGGRWKPVFHMPTDVIPDELATAVFDGMRARKLLEALSGDPRALLGSDLKAPLENFVAFSERVAVLAKPDDRRLADVASSYGSEIVWKNTGKGPRIETTDLCFTAGNQQFLNMERELSLTTSISDVRNALFDQWTYQDRCPSFRWDPVADDRQYALRAVDPAPEKTRSIRAANLLACQALELFPTVPTSQGLLTTAFAENLFYWPMWTVPASLDAARSLLSYVTNAIRQTKGLAAIGVSQVFVSRKVRYVGYYGKFTPAVPV
jgi:hypothetical protein